MHWPWIFFNWRCLYIRNVCIYWVVLSESFHLNTQDCHFVWRRQKRRPILLCHLSEANISSWLGCYPSFPAKMMITKALLPQSWFCLCLRFRTEWFGGLIFFFFFLMMDMMFEQIKIYFVWNRIEDWHLIHFVWYEDMCKPFPKGSLGLGGSSICIGFF